jgi:hypothetical protein
MLMALPCDEPRLAPIEPDAECVEILDKARAYVAKKLEGKFLASYADLGQTPAYMSCRRAIINALAMSDLEKTKVACRTWYTLVIDHTLAHRKENV